VQSAQSAHCAIQFVMDHSTISSEWFKKSNYLVLLSVQNEQELLSFVEKFNKNGIVFSCFYEPDLDNQLTSISFLSDDISRKLVSNLPLLLKEYNKN